MKKATFFPICFIANAVTNPNDDYSQLNLEIYYVDKLTILELGS